MAFLKRSKQSISGLSQDLDTLQQNINAEAQTRATNDGDLTTLVTVAKNSLTAAINEVSGVAAAATQSAADSLKAASNLSDLADKVVARTNLEVLSGSEIDAKILEAKLALGSNFNAADIAERDALTGLDLADRVFVVDDGDGKWAMYKALTVDEAGTATSWLKLSDQDSLENSINGPAIKASYESNPDTNAYTDADKAKVDFVSVTKAVDLDDVVVKAGLVQDLAVSAPADNAPSAAAVKASVDAAAAASSVHMKLETLVVAGDSITLTETPKGGVAGVLNFATVRYIDETGTAFDAPVIGTADAKVFTISADTAGQLDTKSVQIQYMYVPA